MLSKKIKPIDLIITVCFQMNVQGSLQPEVKKCFSIVYDKSYIDMP